MCACCVLNHGNLGHAVFTREFLNCFKKSVREVCRKVPDASSKANHCRLITVQVFLCFGHDLLLYNVIVAVLCALRT